MAVTKFLARDLAWEINTGSVAVPVWTPIKGLNSSSHSPGTTRTDVSDFDSDGNAEHLVAERSQSWSMSGFYLEDVADGARDPGQAALITAAGLKGAAALKQFRQTTPGGNTKTLFASVQVTGPAGGHNDAAAWSVELTVSGAVVDA